MAFVDRLIGLASPKAALRRAIELTEQRRFVEAFPLLSVAARAGIDDADYRIALAYFRGLGVPACQSEGVDWLRKAAERGSVEAQVTLGVLCLHGLAGGEEADKAVEAPATSRLFATVALREPDFKSAMKWARMAADTGSGEGQALVGYLRTHGPEGMRDLEDAHRWYGLSASGGCPQGALGYALSLLQRASDEATQREAAVHLRRAAEAGLPTAIHLLGSVTEHGIGVTRDSHAATELYRRAAEGGVPAAQVQWGRALIEGRHVRKDPITGESWLRRAALAGDSEAAAALGDLYSRNGASSGDYAEAAIWYRKAAESGHRAAAKALGTLYLTGAGVARDESEATNWLRISADAGDCSSQVDLANLILKGGGNADDPSRIIGWFGQAATAGDPVAAFNLGLCLVKGFGVARDEALAMQWMRWAAEALPEAQHAYAQMLAEGVVAPADPRGARSWFHMAADAGIMDAQVSLAEMMLNGRGGPRDIHGAVALFEKAAAKGHGGAMFALGAVHGGGHGLPTNRAVAERWFHAAAEAGHAEARLMLAKYLADGVAGERGRAEARSCSERAAPPAVTRPGSEAPGENSKDM